MENLDFFLSQYVNNPHEFAKFHSSLKAVEEQHATLSDIVGLRSAIESMPNPTFEEMLPRLRRFLASESIRKFFEQELSGSLNSDIYQPVGKALDAEVMTGLQFIESKHFAIAAVAIDPVALAFKKRRNRGKSTSIRMTPKDVLMRFIKAGGAVVTIHSCDAITDVSPANANMRCHLERRFEVKDDDEIVLRAGEGSLSFESSQSSVCMVQAYVKHSPVPVAPEFDSHDMKLIGLSATNDTSPRIQLMCTILRLFKQHDMFDDCLPFTQHPDYFVRWYVMRELLAVNPERAWPLVIDMAEHDPNKAIRETASRTINKLRSCLVMT